MYCPQCRAEYREGFVECSDCHVPLAAGVPPTPPEEPVETVDPPDPEIDLVTVLETDDTVLLSLAKSVLEEAEMEFAVVGKVYMGGGRPSYMPNWFGNVERIQVRRDCEAQAREILADLRKN